jgi:MFS family permease
MFKTRSVRDNFGFLSGNVAVFSITDLLGNFSRAMVFPYASLYILALGGSATQIGLVNALAPTAGLLMFPLAGYIADHAGRIKLIVLGNVMSFLMVLMYVVAPSWEFIAAAIFLRGFLVIQFPAKSALLADSLAPEDRGRGIATMRTLSNSLAIFAPLIAGTVVDSFGPNSGLRSLYVVMLLLYLSNTFIHLRFLKETSTPATKPLRVSDFPRILADTYRGVPNMLRRFPRSIRALTGVSILGFMANGVASPFWVVYAVEQIGLSPTEWGLILLIETVLRLLMFLPVGLLVDRWGRTISLLVALTLSMVAIPMFVLARSFTAVLLIRAAVAIAFAMAIPASVALMADSVPRGMRGRVMAAIGQGGFMIGAAGGGMGGPANGFLIILPTMISSLLGGFLYAWNPRLPWLFVLATSAVSVLLTTFFIRDPQQAEV